MVIQAIEKLNPTAKRPYEFLNSSKTIVLGIGNESRGDDGLGWAFLNALEKCKGFEGEIEFRYLLLVEDAQHIADYDNVIFVDASHAEIKKGFSFEIVESGGKFEFSTHIIPPESILYLTEELYESHPKAYTLAIEGKQWKLGEGMSEHAKINLDQAVRFFVDEIL